MIRSPSLHCWDNAVAMASRPAAMEIGGAFGQEAAWLGMEV